MFFRHHTQNDMEPLLDLLQSRLDRAQTEFERLQKETHERDPKPNMPPNVRTQFKRMHGLSIEEYAQKNHIELEAIKSEKAYKDAIQSHQQLVTLCREWKRRNKNLMDKRAEVLKLRENLRQEQILRELRLVMEYTPMLDFHSEPEQTDALGNWMPQPPTLFMNSARRAFFFSTYSQPSTKRLRIEGEDEEFKGVGEECFMCYTNKSQVTCTSCKQKAGCFSCLNTYGQNSCPLCRKPLEEC